MGIGARTRKPLRSVAKIAICSKLLNGCLTASVIFKLGIDRTGIDADVTWAPRRTDNPYVGVDANRHIRSSHLPDVPILTVTGR